MKTVDKGMSETIDLTAFRMLSFDCYGTLIDWESGIADTLGEWAVEHGRSFEREQLLEVFARTEPRVEHAHPAMRYSQLLEIVHRELGNELGVDVSDDDARRFGEAVGSWPAFSDSSDALKVLKTHYRLMIVSNVDAASFAGSQRTLGIDFDEVVTAEQVGAYKPDRRMFDAAFERAAAAGVERDRILHVAQSLFHDHVPAKELDMTTVWVDRRRGLEGSGATPDPGVEVSPDIVVGSMGDLADLVSEAFGG